MIPLSKELEARKEIWRSKGFLVPSGEGSYRKEYEFKLFGRLYIAEIRKSSTGLWDSFNATGSVRTMLLSLHKERYLTEDGCVLEAKQVVLFKWIFSWASWKLA